MTTTTDLSTQIYRVFVKATPERVWQAIIDPTQTALYFYGARIAVTPERREVHGPDGSSWGDGPVLEWDPPRRLVHEWSSAYDPELAQEAVSRVTWEIEAQEGGCCLVTLTHDRLEGAPRTAESVAGAGWMFVLSGLKTLVETGAPLTDAS